MNDHLHPVFAGILNAAAGRPDHTPAGEVPTPAPLAFPKPQMREFGSRSGMGEGSKVCPFCGIGHDNRHRYCDDRCAHLDNL